MADLDATWAGHDAAWRDPAQVAAHSEQAAGVRRDLLRTRTRGPFWDLLAERRLTLLVAREYEHLLAGLSTLDGRPHVTFAPLPHPSGIAVDRRARRVHVASTRNPNVLFELAPAVRAPELADGRLPDAPLVPVRSRFLPGRLYLHDLALIGGVLHGNAVGENAVVAFAEDGGVRRVWWPRAIERSGRPDFSRNYLQLNSIAAGPDVAGSFFTASAAVPAARRPGQRNFPVDGRGVLFSGTTREPVAGGLTRPHSARLERGSVWLANSGYGELGRVRDEDFEAIARLPGWTRGLCVDRGVAWVGTSRVIPRFRSYAPGLDVDRSRCGVHAVELRSGRVLASLTWPRGNQVFAVEAVPQSLTRGFAFRVGSRGGARTRALFYDHTIAATR